jgi:hypothetical protein
VASVILFFTSAIYQCLYFQRVFCGLWYNIGLCCHVNLLSILPDVMQSECGRLATLYWDVASPADVVADKTDAPEDDDDYLDVKGCVRLCVRVCARVGSLFSTRCPCRSLP